MSRLRLLIVITVLLLSSPATANDQELPLLWGNLDWSSDGEYIAVTTNYGIHVHHSDDLSLYKVLNDSNLPAIKWSNAGLKLAFETSEPKRLTVWDLTSEEHVYLSIPDARNSRPIFSIQWAPWDTTIAAASDLGIYIWNLETLRVFNEISYRGLHAGGYPHLDWRPDSVDIMSGSITNGIAIWNYYTGILVDFIWNTSGGNRPARWSPDGNMIAAGDGPVIVWKVLPDHPADAWAEIGGEKIHRLTYESGWIYGLGWHPDSTKLAFIFSHSESGYPPEQDFSRDGALIWDLSTDTTRLIPGVFVIDVSRTDKVIEWSPSGRKLAAISSDGRIVIWETDTYQVIAEYDGYRSLLDP